MRESDCAYDSTSNVDTDEDTRPLPKRRKTSSGAGVNTIELGSLFDLAAEVVATVIPFSAVEQYYHKSPNKIHDDVLFAIIKRAFPTDRDMVGLCAGLSRPSFYGDDFYRESSDCDIIAKEVIQTGVNRTIGTLAMSIMICMSLVKLSLSLFRLCMRSPEV